MAWGRRCEMGCETWPDDKRYKKCPLCGEDAERYSNLKPLSKLEALKAEFEAFYTNWEANHDASRLAADAPDARGPYAVVEGSALLLPRSSA